ncbi:MAG: carbohydrate kinase family protein [Ilumatobacter sp.]|uniref:carbohydrate kinase family protein n=1 Tax=Ilumatobacter sp. TaxID=1967498 RepID=UPI00391C83D5
MLATLGDLIEDVVVRLGGPINVASDTASIITRRRGGSAANVAASARSAGAPPGAVRFLGQVGDDVIGDALVADLHSLGVDTTHVRHAGTTGTIIVLVDEDGERTMLTDRRTCTALDHPEPEWLDGVTTLHVPLYSFADGATAATARTVVDWAHRRSIAVTVDLSSTALLRAFGASAVRDLVASLEPQVVFANHDEAAAVGLPELALDAITVVKDGPRPAVIRVPGSDQVDEFMLAVPAISIAHVEDSTGAGDAFAAGFLAADWRVDPIAACASAHRCAHTLLTTTRLDTQIS